MGAPEILQDYLDAMGACVMAGDFDVYRAGVSLPFHLITAAANIVISTEDELRSGFETFVAMLGTQAVTDYVRLADSAVFLQETLISGHYTTHIVAGSNRVVPPFPSQIILRQGPDDVWRGASISNNMRNRAWPVHLVQIAPVQ